MKTLDEVDTAATETEPFKNRSGGLILFGFLLLGLSLCAFGFMGLMLLGQALGAAQPAGTMAVNTVVYGGGGLLLAILGIGSMMACRWARALTLCIMCIVLAVGVVSLFIVPAVMMHFNFETLPEMGNTDPAQLAVMKAFMVAGVAFVLAIQILIPLPFILFYRSPHVKATCEWKHPHPSWTDACPLPVLALVLLSAYGAIYCLIMAFAMPAFPWLDTILTGTPATGLLLGIAVLTALLTWGLYQLRMGAWWATMLLLICGSAYCAFTLPKVDLEGYMEAVGMPTEQVEAMRGMGLYELYQQPMILLCAGIIFLIYLAYLVYVRKYFKDSHS